MDPITALGVISAGASIFGTGASIFGSSASNSQARKAAEQAYEQATDIYEFDWESSLRKYNYAQATVGLQRQTAENVYNYKTKLAEQSWEQQNRIREYDYVNKVAQFNRSERQYEDQRALNTLSATLAQNDAARSFNEAQLSMNFQREGLARDLYQAMDTSAFVKADIELKRNNAIADSRVKRKQNQFEYQSKAIDNAFTAQENSVKALLGEGKARSRGSGRSTGKAVQSILATAGRQQAAVVQSMATAEQRFKIQATAIDQSMINSINTADLQNAKEDNDIDYKREVYNQNLRELDASLDSAEASYKSNLMKINRDKQAADMNAHYNRMLEPSIGPEIPKPIELPKSVFLDPLKPIKPPKPRKMAPNTQSSWTTFAQAASGIGDAVGNISSIGNMANWF